MSDSLTVITNNVPRFTLDAFELSTQERADFDYIDWQAIERGEESATFIRYKGTLYDLSDIESVPVAMKMTDNPLAEWDGFISDSFFSGVVFKWAKEDGRTDFERVICGRYYA